MGAFGFGFVVGFVASVVLLSLNERRDANWALELPSGDDDSLTTELSLEAGRVRDASRTA